MSNLETLVRDALNDDRRRMAPPHDAIRWVGSAVRRQRRRRAALGAAAAAVVALVAAAVVLPIVNDDPATYVAGRPDVASGLLPWEPAGALVDEADVVTSAVEAWEDLADDEPTGNVYLVAGDRWDDTEVVVLQARTESDTAAVAQLTTTDGALGPWALVDVTTLPAAGGVEALLLPSGSVPRDPLTVGRGNPASLLLAPKWRHIAERGESPLNAWQLSPASPWSGSDPTWRDIDDFDGYDWWVSLRSVAPGLSPTKVLLDRGARVNRGVAPILDIDDAASLAALTPSDVSFKLLPRESANPEPLGLIDAVIERLGLTGAVEVTVLDWGSGWVSTGNQRPPATEHLFAQFDAPDMPRPLLVVYTVTGDDVTCFTKRRVPATDVTALSFVGLACPFPVAGAPRGQEGNVLYARSFIDEPDLKDSVLEFTVTMVRPNGQSTISDLSSKVGAIEGPPAEPAVRYVFRATETFDGGALDPWVWPGSD